jgi:L-asparagine transporter-like permease
MEKIITDYTTYGWVYLVVVLMCVVSPLTSESSFTKRVFSMVPLWWTLDFALHHL